MIRLYVNDIDMYARYGYYVTKVSNRTFQTIKNTTFSPENISGEKVIQTSYTKKPIQIFGYLLNIMQNKRGLIQFISELTDKTFKLYFSDTQKTIYARMDGDCFEFEAQGGNLYAVSFNVVAFEPYSFGDAYTESIISPYTNIYSEAPDYLISPLQSFYERINNVDIGHFTILNYLGVNGNFEDANALQNGWSATNVTASKGPGYFNTKSQRLQATATTGQHNISCDLSRFTTGYPRKYFFKVKVKPTNGYIRVVLENRKIDGTYESTSSTIGVQPTSLWSDVYKTFTITSLYSVPDFKVYISLTNAEGDLSYTGTNEDAFADGAMLVDLTNMGDLPIPIKDFFNNSTYTAWSHLATTSSITAGGRTQTGEAWLNELLTFVDSGSTFGATYATNAYTMMIYNKGENLFNSDDYTPKYYESNYPIYEYNGDSILPNIYKNNTQYTIKATAKNASITITYSDATIAETTFNATAYESKTITSTSGKTIYTVTFTGKFALDTIMIYEGTANRAYQKCLNNYLKINNVAFNYLGISDIIYNDKGTLKKYKRWYYETVVKSTTFPETIYNGTGSCVLVKSTGEIYFSTITGKSIGTSSIPDGTYIVFYQLVTPVYEDIPYEGSLSLISGNNHITSNCSVLSFKLIGNKRYLEV